MDFPEFLHRFFMFSWIFMDFSWIFIDFHGFFMDFHVGTLYGQRTQGSATRWSPERVTGVTIRSHNPIFAAIHCTKLRLVQMRQPK